MLEIILPADQTAIAQNTITAVEVCLPQEPTQESSVLNDSLAEAFAVSSVTKVPATKPGYPAKKHQGSGGFFLTRTIGNGRGVGQLLVMTRKRQATHLKAIEMFLPEEIKFVPPPTKEELSKSSDIGWSASDSLEKNEQTKVFFDKAKLKPGLVFDVLEIAVDKCNGKAEFQLKKLDGKPIHKALPYSPETCPLLMTPEQEEMLQAFTGIVAKFQRGKPGIIPSLYKDDPIPPVMKDEKLSEPTPPRSKYKFNRPRQYVNTQNDRWVEHQSHASQYALRPTVINDLATVFDRVGAALAAKNVAQ